MLNIVWTFEAESHVAHAIRAAEGRALLELAGVDVAQRILRAVPARAEHTRAAAVGRVAAAVLATREAAARRPELRTLAARAMVAWRRSEELAWELGMSAQRIAIVEARRLISPYLDEEDLIQEGFIGLLYAARRFEPQRGLRFSTYARWWVRAHMSRAIETASRLVRLPGGVVEQRRNLSHAAEELGLAGLSADRGALATQVGFRPKRVELLMGLGAAVNLDEVDADGHSVLDHLVSDDDVETRADAALSRLQLLRKLSEGFDSSLNPSERFILTNHFGLKDSLPLTRVEIGGLMSMSRERVRLAELGALRRLHRMLTTTSAAPRRSPVEHRGETPATR
jgi:RNA polymerase sigma factor (sigma-70 family)